MRHDGFTLMEVLVAMAVIMVAALGGMQLVSMAIGTIASARTQSLATGLASARIEQLRGLQFEYDGAGIRVTDTSTDLTIDPPGPGGAGLSPSGPSTLDSNVPGYVDFLDGRGQWVGNGASAPPGAALVRRWAVEPIDAGGDLLALQVLVRSIDGGTVPTGRRAAGETRFVTIRARVRP